MRARSFLTAVVAAAAFTATSTAQAAPASADLKQQVISLRLTVGSAKRLIASERETIRTGQMWVWTGPQIAVLVRPVNIERRRVVLRTLQHVLARSRAQLARVEARYQAALRPPHYEQWLCIHRYEGSWTDTDSPFWGGLQMNLGFQQTYAAMYAEAFHVPNPYITLGTADHWSPLTQMWVAEQAVKSRGFWPWPNTARYCGLL